VHDGQPGVHELTLGLISSLLRPYVRHCESGPEAQTSRPYFPVDGQFQSQPPAITMAIHELQGKG
jgi:hypothetical protein